jgi:DNA helicase HerA-like ATPase
MLREGRSKGLAVILATQAPSDLPEVVDTNAQTRICFRLSDAVIAGQAARKLDPSDEALPERIRTLATGEAFVSLEGQAPQLLSMAQHYRDRERFEAEGMGKPPDKD